MVKSKKDIVYVKYSELQNFCDKNKIYHGIIMFSDNRAMLYSDSLDVRLYITNGNIYFEKSDFSFFIDIGFEIIGKGKNEIDTNLEMFIDDLKNNRIKVAISTILLLIFLNPYIMSINGYADISEIILSTLGVFIGMIMVFIGFYFGDRNRTIETYKKGSGDKDFYANKYIIEIAVIAIVLALLAFIVSKATMSNYIDNEKLLHLLRTYKIKGWSILLFIAISISLIIIELDALINYYLKGMRTTYFIDAFEELIKK